MVLKIQVVDKAKIMRIGELCKYAVNGMPKRSLTSALCYICMRLSTKQDRRAAEFSF